MKIRIPNRQAFTLIELLVSMSIIGLLVALLLPAVHSARESSRRMQCRNNLKQIGIAMHSYHDVHRSFPVGQYIDGKGHGWASAVLPYIEQVNVHNRINFDLPYFHAGNREVASVILPIYLCPSMVTSAIDRKGRSAAGFGAIDYGCMLGAVAPLAAPPVVAKEIPYTDSHGVFPWPSFGSSGGGVVTRMSQITDGTSNTMLVGEDSGRGLRDGGAWIAGASLIDQQLPGINLTYDNELFSDHPGGVNILLGDGGVRFMAENVSLRLLVGICNRDDGITIGEY